MLLGLAPQPSRCVPKPGGAHHGNAAPLLPRAMPGTELACRACLNPSVQCETRDPARWVVA